MSVHALKTDHIVRATAADGCVRALGAYTRGVVEKARCVHGLSRTATAALGRTLTAGCMMGSTMKGDSDALSIVFTGDGPLKNITVTAKADGSVKGYVGNPTASLPSAAGEKLKVGGIVGKGTLRVIHDIALRDPYSGVVEIQTGEIADDLAYYFTASDQVPSAVALGVLLADDNSVREAGGYIIQMMPGASDELAEEIEQRIAALPSVTEMLSQGERAEDILEKILGEYELNVLEHTPATFRCDCNRERTEKLLALMGPDELQKLIDEDEGAELACVFCNEKYAFSTDELRAILAKGSS